MRTEKAWVEVVQARERRGAMAVSLEAHDSQASVEVVGKAAWVIEAVIRVLVEAERASVEAARVQVEVVKASVGVERA